MPVVIITTRDKEKWIRIAFRRKEGGGRTLDQIADQAFYCNRVFIEKRRDESRIGNQNRFGLFFLFIY